MYYNPSLWRVIQRLKFLDREPDDNSTPPWVAMRRPFVWNEEQIARLFDSMMRGFPIGTLLIWRTDAAVKHQYFVDEWPGSIVAAGTGVQHGTGAKDIVLDGHQRLQSLLLGLAGSYDGRELYFDVTSGEETLPVGTRYCFGFKDAGASWPWVRFKRIVGEMSRDRTFPVFSEDPWPVASSGARTEAERMLIAHNVQQAVDVFGEVGAIHYEYFVRDSFEQYRGHPENYTVEDAAEIFRRINACGTEPDRLMAAFA